jgi:CheY-like chemotaxis protein
MAQQTFQAAGYRVLVVDDNELNREVALAEIEPYGCQLAQAESGAQAIELVREQTFDLIFMDYLMPEMDGLETVRRLRRECGVNGETPVIAALTAEETPELLERFRDSGCQEVLAKPIDPDQLHRLMDRWVPQELRQAQTAPAPEPGMTAEELRSLQMEGIDLTGTGIGRGKTKAQYQQLLSLFYLDGKKSLTAWQPVDEDRLEEYRIWVHGLKSAAANIGAMEVSALAREQENAAKAGDLETIRTRSPALFDRYGRVLAEIARVLEDPGEQGTEERDALDPEQLQAQLRQALELLEDFQTKECAQRVELLLGYRLPQQTRTLLNQVRDKLRMYADDEAEEQLREAIAQQDRKL